MSIRSVAPFMPGVTVDGNDVLAVYEAAGKAVQRARLGEGPTLLECKTYRWRGHHEGDPNQGRRYRTLEEIRRVDEKCPVARLEEKLVKREILAESEDQEESGRKWKRRSKGRLLSPK